MALRNRKLPRHILVIRNSAMGDVAMVPHALRALREAYKTDEALSYNVSPETCLDTLLFTIREVLHGSGNTY